MGPSSQIEPSAYGTSLHVMSVRDCVATSSRGLHRQTVATEWGLTLDRSDATQPKGPPQKNLVGHTRGPAWIFSWLCTVYELVHVTVKRMNAAAGLRELLHDRPIIYMN